LLPPEKSDGGLLPSPVTRRSYLFYRIVQLVLLSRRMADIARAQISTLGKNSRAAENSNLNSQKSGNSNANA